MGRRSNLLALTVVMLLTLVLSACGGGGKDAVQKNTENESTQSSKSPESATKKADPVVIEFATGTDASGALLKSIERFNASRQDIQIKYVEMPEGYAQWLEETGRGHVIPELRKRHPSEFTNG
jgi:ABC-type glycerol-3-phosphate transport system substrate-binding protein